MAETLGKDLADADRSRLARSNVQDVIPYRYLRERLAEADRLGEVVYADGLNVEEEIGMASELVMHPEDAPCVVFTRACHRQGYAVPMMPQLGSGARAAPARREAA